jgi:hypothetical protein
MEKRELNRWIILSFISLLIVAILGVLMRYKIGFSFPFLDQKNLQEAHSHFAFSGWVTQILFVLMNQSLEAGIPKKRQRQYNYLLGVNWLNSVFMLIAFAIQGYAFYSILFSSVSLVISFVFAGFFWNDIKFSTNATAGQWFKYALFFMIISTLGTISLMVMLISKNMQQHTYLASIYWYLHFQYNGWFFFACIGLIYNHFGKWHEYFNTNRLALKLLAFSCVPAYGLSILWMKLPLWVEIIIAIAAAVQAIGWSLIIFQFYKLGIFKGDVIKRYIKYLLIIIAITGSLKFCLQVGSTVPAISKLAFGFRPIVIAYLHLVLLAFISLLLITYAFMRGLAIMNKTAIVGIVIFVFGVFVNEFLLAIQGIMSLSYILIPNINYLLFAASLILLTGAILLVMSQLMIEQKD